MVRSGPIQQMLEVDGGQRPALVFVNNLDLRRTLLPLSALGLGAVVAAGAAITDSGEPLLLGLLISVVALAAVLWLLVEWTGRRLTRDRIFFALARDGVVVGSLRGANVRSLGVD